MITLKKASKKANPKVRFHVVVCLNNVVNTLIIFLILIFQSKNDIFQYQFSLSKQVNHVFDLPF